MKVSASKFDLKARPEVRDSVVLADDFHRQKFGLGMLHHNCLVVNDVTAAHRALTDEQFPNLTILDSRLEVLSTHLQEFSKEVTEGDVVLRVVLPSDDLLAFFDAIDATNAGSDLSVTSASFKDGLALITLVKSESKDAPVDSLLAGVLLGAETSYPITSEPIECNEREAEVEAKLLSLLEALPLATNTIAPEPKDTRPEPPAGADVNRAHLKEIENLQSQLVAMRTELDRLQRRYDALAGSRLGKITLNHWNRKSKGHKP